MNRRWVEGTGKVISLLFSLSFYIILVFPLSSPVFSWSSLQEVQVRMGEVEQLYTEVVEVAVLRQQWLHDALAVYRMFSEVNACELWIDEKEQWLDKMEIPERLEDVEVVAHR